MELILIYICLYPFVEELVESLAASAAGAAHLADGPPPCVQTDGDEIGKKVCNGEFVELLTDVRLPATSNLIGRFRL